jgi:hypothetical protein
MHVTSNQIRRDANLRNDSTADKADELLQNESVNGGKHENGILLIYTDACGFSRLHDRTDDGYDDNYHAGGDHDEPRARSYSHPSAAAGSRGNSDGGTRTGLRLDNRLLAMDWYDLRVDAGRMGCPPAPHRSLGRRSLGPSLQRLGVGPGPLAIAAPDAIVREQVHQPRILAKTSGATIVASDSMTNRGVSTFSFPHVIFSFGTAPEYEPKLVVESLIWQK